MRKEFETKQKFIEVYSEFNKWLASLGFRRANTKETMSYLTYHYTHYDKHINSLWGVENYIQDTLNMSIHFLRDRDEHKIMFVGELGSYSETFTIDEVKELILIQFKQIRDEQLSKLTALSNF